LRYNIPAAVLIAAFWIFSSCANKVMPTGGEKDIKSPVLLSASPENYSLNFNSKKILLEFNEYIELKDIQKQLIISPPLNPAPEMEIKKRTLLITLPDSLLENTTYTINFGNAVADYTEGNALTGFMYIFSTGSILDSLVVTGLLQDALTLKPVKEAIALLYTAATPDSMIGITPPMYYARTNEAGLFMIRNVREGDYRLIGLDDKNNNYTAEMTTEPVGEAEQIIHLKDSVFSYASLAKQPDANQIVKFAFREPPGKLITAFSLPVDEPTWKFLTPEPSEVIMDLSSNRDTVILYTLPGVADSTTLIWFNDNKVIDTVVYRQERQRDVVVNHAKSNAKYFPSANGSLIHETKPSLKWSAPLKNYDESRVKVLKDSAEFKVQSNFVDSLKTLTVFDAVWKEGSYIISVLPGASTDIYNRTNDTIQFFFNVPAEQTKGSIAFNYVAKNPGKMLLQLVNDKDEMIRQRSANGSLKGLFEMIDPGTYKLRSIADENDNGKWDAGDFKKHIYPEKVTYHNESITVRANWEVEIDWTE